MLDNQTIQRKDSDSFSKQIFSQTLMTESDSQTMEEILKQLEEQETKIEKTNSPSVVVLSAQETGTTTPKETPLVVNENSEKQKEPEKTAPEEQPTKDDSSEINFKHFLEPLKNAKFKYEQLGQPGDEKKISGAEALETYLYWVEESRKLLNENFPDEKKKEIFLFIPKRIQQQIEKGETSPSSVLESSLESSETSIKEIPLDPVSPPSEPKEKEPTLDNKDSILLERIRRLEDQINKLNQDKPEYPEELQPLATKKFLMEEEIKNAEKDSGTKEVDQEKVKQELSAQELLNKQSFENKAPVIQPQKEERERIQKAQLAEKIEKEEAEKKAKERKIVEEPLPSFTSEQIEAALQKRKEFHQKLYSLNKTEWYQSPSVNRDFVNKQIIEAATILSGKDSMAINMRDVQTARVFMFNNISKKILSHPAFSYVESFYNYQSSQSCFGANPEEIFSQNNNPSLKNSPEEVPKAKKGILFVEQLSIKEDGEEEVYEAPVESVEEIEEEEGTGENSFLD